VREATPADAEAVAELSRELARVLGDAGNPAPAIQDPVAFRRDGFGPDAAFSVLVAERDGRVVGYLLHHPGYDPDLGGRTCVVVDLMVHEAVRRRGVGRALMEAAAARCRAAGGTALTWWVREANQRAVAFYRSLGAQGYGGTAPLPMHLPVREDA
jgi:ribosomal protein S18 acetylase RimI-like enzyme